MVQPPSRRTIMFSHTLGTALGNFLGDIGGLGYSGGPLIFGTALAVVAGLYFLTRASRILLLWAVSILTRLLGATVGDVLDKPQVPGGLNLSHFAASGVLLALMAGLILLYPQQPGRHPGQA